MRAVRIVVVILSLAMALVAAGPTDAAAAPELVKGTRTVRDGTRATDKVACPSGTSVVGGGVDVAGGNTFNSISSSGPYDSSDSGKVPDDGWRATMNNTTGTDRKMTTYAICSAGRFKYSRSSTDLAAGAGAQTIQSCPDGTQVVGGGAVISGGGLETVLEFTTPADDFFAPDGIPDNGWSIAVDNADSSASASYVTTAICSSSGVYSYAEESGTLGASGATQELRAECPPGTKVLSGGGYNDDFTGTLHESVPSDASDQNSQRDDSWLVGFNAAAGGNATTYAVCRD